MNKGTKRPMAVHNLFSIPKEMIGFLFKTKNILHLLFVYSKQPIDVVYLSLYIIIFYLFLVIKKHSEHDIILCIVFLNIVQTHSYKFRYFWKICQNVLLTQKNAADIQSYKGDVT